MRRGFVFIAVLCLALMVAATASHATRIYAPASGDATYIHNIYRYDVEPGGEVGAPTLTISLVESAPGEPYHVESRMPLVQMPISSLQDVMLTPGSAKLWFYSFGLVNTYVYGLNYDTDGRIWEGREPVTMVTYLTSAGEGWQSVDITSMLQTQISAGYNWAAYQFIPATPYGLPVGSGSIAAAEDLQGRGSYIEITPVPEPSSMLALLAGVTGLSGALIRRCR